MRMGRLVATAQRVAALGFLAMLLAYCIVSTPSQAGARAPETTALAGLDTVLHAVNYTRILKHVEYLSSLGSRVTGYAGYYEATKYIAEEFKSYGLEVELQPYKVLVPLDKGSYIKVLVGGGNLTIPAYAVWPNYVQTSFVPPEKPVRGKLVYVGGGRLEDFDGKEVEGRIVVMDFNSGSNWVNAAKLGAAAVVFLEPSDTDFREARGKFLNTPIHFPRLYVRGEYAAILKQLAEKGVEAELVCNMKFEEVEAYNIVAKLEGARPNDVIVVSAHYDTWSAVPALAPGADEAVSAAALLELARVFSRSKPNMTLWFVAFSGHWQGLAGPREFVEKYFFDPNVVKGERKIWALMNIDFSTENKAVNLLYAGLFYEYSGGPITAIETRWTRWLEPTIFRRVLPALESTTGRNYTVVSGFYGVYGWWGANYGPYMLDSEPFAIAHGLGFTLYTVSKRLTWGHPLSTLEKVDIENLKPQLEVAAAILYYLSVNGVQMDWGLVKPERALYAAGGADVAGYITLYGQVLVYNFSKGWYDPVPNAIVVVRRSLPSYSSYPFNVILTKSDERGRFTVHGIGGLFAVSHAGWGGAQIYVEAYKFDEKTGFIVYAPDRGQYGQMQISFLYQPDRHPYNVSTVVFRCSSIVLFDIVDPISLSPLLFLDPRFESSVYPPWQTTPYLIQVLDASTLSVHLTWGLHSTGYEDVAMVFVPPRSRSFIVYKLTSAYKIVGVIANASEANPEGSGVYVGDLEELRLSFTALKFAYDLFSIAKHRYGALKSRFVESAVADDFLGLASRYFNLALSSFEEKNYSRAYTYTKVAWLYTAQAYNEVMRLINDTVNTNFLVLVIFIPSAVLLAMLVTAATGKRRFLAVAIILLTLTAIYYMVHPAPQVAAVFWMSPLSVGLTLFFSFTAGLFMGKAVDQARRYRTKVLGKHFAETLVTDITFMLADMSINFMKRRKLRTILTLILIIIVVFSLVGLTSIMPLATATFTKPTVYSPTYKGLLIRRLTIEQVPQNIVDPGSLDVLRELTGLSFCRRVWWYPESVAGRSVYTTVLGKGNKQYSVRALLGVDPNEVLPLKSEALIAGRWFMENDYFACIVTDRLAQALNVTVGDEVFLPSHNLRLMVVGVISADVANRLRDLDGYSITPVNPNAVSALLRGYVLEEVRLPLSYDEVLLVPSKLALDLGGYLASVAAAHEDYAFVREAALKLAKPLELLNFYICDGSDVTMVSPYLAFALQGWVLVMIPTVIAVAMVSITILGSIRERRREISTLTSLGLSPRGVGVVFVVETLCYAFMGASIGYILGILANIAMIKMNLLPPGFIANVSSLATAAALLISILAILLQSAYPAVMASKIVVPSLARKWEIPTKPRGDEWEIPLPFATRDRGEIPGIIYYLYEYLDAHRKESPEVFIVEDVAIEGPERLHAVVRLQPLEAGVVQDVMISALWNDIEQRATFSVRLRRLGGVLETWVSRNRYFVDALRKQFLMWRGLRPEDKREYIRRFAEKVGSR
jgi:hypothetical protein